MNLISLLRGYELVVLGWRDADPVIQTRVENARRAAERLRAAGHRID